MLRELSIENLAVIEKASITFGDKMNVFTGETGAGKSILIGGINAILGGRVSKDIVRFGADKAVVIGLFDDIPERIIAKLTEYGFNAEDELLLQREITSDGKSIARINGRTATVATLKEIASELINIHGQHDNQLLMSCDKQREILDNYADIGELLSEYKAVFKDFSSISRKIKEVSDASRKQTERADILSERLSELDEYKFEADEEDAVNKKIEELRNAEYIEDNLYGAVQAISGDDEETGAYTLLQRVRSNVTSLCEIIPDFSDIEKRVSDMLVDLEDIRAEISSKLGDSGEDSAKLLSKYEERLSDILRIKRKYRMDIPELLEVAEEWRQELYTINNSEDILEKLSEQRRETGEKLKKLGSELTRCRKKAAEELAKRISEELTFLDMPDIRLVFDISQDKVTSNGMDMVEMLISVNKGEELKSMSKIASGGELSRIMLAIKTVLASSDDIGTMIFDEIDTGISGRAAHKVGTKLYEVGRTRQILCVTHLAQIAAMADTHLLISKSSDENRTYTDIKTLDFEGRKREIARIISGDENSEISLENAEELLNRISR